MLNQQIAEIFNNMSSYIDMEGGKNAYFRSRASKVAAEVVSKFPHDFASPEWKDIKKLKKIKGVGQSTAEHIIEFIETGKIQEYEKMKQNSPVKLEELSNIQGVGPKTILKLYNELGVTDIDSLKRVAEQGKIAELEGFGEKKQESILESIEFAIMQKGRISIAIAEIEIEKLVMYMKQDSNIIKIEPVGSFRRRKETIGDIDLLVSSQNPINTISHFTLYPQIEKILGHGDTKSSIWLKSKMQADIRVIESNKFGSALQYFTGSKEHNVKLRNIAISKGYKLSEYGLFNRKTNEIIESENEKKIYEFLVGQYITPELRENEGEFEAAHTNTLPHLITLNDIKGDLQMHTIHSDGANSIEEMAQKGKRLGYEYIGITDHFGKLKIANAIDETNFDAYLSEIRHADKKVDGIKIYASAEVEIGRDGELEFDEEKLRQLDYVIASVHFSTKMDKNTMTKRIVTALKNPLTTILAHPTGRLIGQRPGFEFDTDEVFKVAHEQGVALEINAHPQRLDLNDKMARLAVGIGCQIVINTDSHSVNEMDNIRFGVDVARRGWIQKKNLLKL